MTRVNHKLYPNAQSVVRVPQMGGEYDILHPKGHFHGYGEKQNNVYLSDE